MDSPLVRGESQARTGPAKVFDTTSAGSGLQGGPDLVIEMDGALHGLVPVAEVQALVLRVRVCVRVLHTDQQSRHTPELPGERLDERDAPAAPDRHRVDPVPFLQRAER